MSRPKAPPKSQTILLDHGVAPEALAPLAQRHRHISALPDMAEALSDIGMEFMSKRQPWDASKAFEHALNIYRKLAVENPMLTCLVWLRT